MLTAEDKKEIRKIVSDEIEDRTGSMRESLVNLEATLSATLVLHQILVEHSEKLTDH